MLRAKQATEKRRRQLQRFTVLQHGLLVEEDALKLTIGEANATIETTERLFRLAGGVEYKLFCEYSASQDAPGRVLSPDAADPVSAASARRHGRDQEAAAGVSGIIKQLLVLPGAMRTPNMCDAYAALLEQAHLVHEDLTGNKGPTLELVLLAQGHGVAGGGGVAPRMVFVAGSAGLNLAGGLCPPPELPPPVLPQAPAPEGLPFPMAAMPARSRVDWTPSPPSPSAMSFAPGTPG